MSSSLADRDAGHGDTGTLGHRGLISDVAEQRHLVRVIAAVIDVDTGDQVRAGRRNMEHMLLATR